MEVFTVQAKRAEMKQPKSTLLGRDPGYKAGKETEKQKRRQKSVEMKHSENPAKNPQNGHKPGNCQHLGEIGSQNRQYTHKNGQKGAGSRADFGAP